MQADDWADATWEPFRGCSAVSSGCDHCLAERIAAATAAHGQPFESVASAKSGRWNGRLELDSSKLTWPLFAGVERIAVSWLSDLFHERAREEWLLAIAGVMLSTPRSRFLVVTKRPARAREFLRDGNATRALRALRRVLEAQGVSLQRELQHTWPPPNLFLLASIEDQQSAADRLGVLAATPGVERGAVCEPLLAPIDLAPWIDSLSWVLAGGELGGGARPAHPAWFRRIRDLCRRTQTPFYFKQWGAWTEVALECEDSIELVDKDLGRAFVAPWRPRHELVGRLLDGRLWNELPEPKSTERRRGVS